jgi:hypothetical protein
VDESVSLHCRPRDESTLAATVSQEARRKLTIDRRYCAIIAGTCRCENARKRSAQAGVGSGTGHFFLGCRGQVGGDWEKAATLVC